MRRWKGSPPHLNFNTKGFVISLVSFCSAISRLIRSSATGGGYSPRPWPLVLVALPRENR
jgi:hypothetical protein